MASFIKSYFLPKQKVEKLSDKLRRAIETYDKQKKEGNNQKLERSRHKIEVLFSQGVMELLQSDQPQLLSNYVLFSYPQIKEIASEINISGSEIEEAIDALDKASFVDAALKLCNLSDGKVRAIILLAKYGRVNDLSICLRDVDLHDPTMLQAAISYWEQYQGDIRKSPTFANILISIARYAQESLPRNPRVYEILGWYEAAANLYIEEGNQENLQSAAHCFLAAKKYDEAIEIYERLGDYESASKAAEEAGNLEKALQLVINPERKVNLLIRTERFEQAREFAAGLEWPESYYASIKEKARSRIDVKLKSYDFIRALELADIAECSDDERERIVALGRNYFDRGIASATSVDEINAIYQDRVRLEERAGNFAEAARMAEEILQDLKLASLLYEKANLYHRAIEAESREQDAHQDVGNARIRLAELHEKGGNLLKAAQLYESAGQFDKAFRLYENLQNYRQAIECYLKTANPSQDILVRLHTAAGEYEKVVQIFLESGSFSDLEKALSIATAQQLTSHIRVIQERIADFTLGSQNDLENCFAIAKDEILGLYTSIIGIDFGTTNSVVSIYNKKSKKVEIVINSLGAEFEPSFFGFDDDNRPIFGEAARQYALTKPDCVVARVKRNLGQLGFFSLHGKQYRYEAIVAYFLRHLCENAEVYVQSKVEARFNELLESRELKFPAAKVNAFLDSQKGFFHISQVVLSVPAYFNDNQKRATRDSAEIAGFQVRRLLHEPTAAALAYCHRRSYAGKLAVVDLGGGTLDISILDIGEGVNDVQTIGGDTKLGGSDLDTLLVQFAVKNIKETWGIELDETKYPVEMARLRQACEKLKIELSSTTRSTMELNYFLNRPKYTLTLTREELEELCQPILHRINLTVEETLREYGAKIDNYLLVGNATKMPIIDRMMANTIHAKQLRGIDPGVVVATGAALEGAILTGDLDKMILLDIVPYSLGIVTYAEEKDEAVISRLIEKNSTIPIKTSQIYTTKVDNQSNVHIEVYQGESPQPAKDYFLGDFILDRIPPAPAHTPQIEVTFDIGVDCILMVTAQDKATKNQRSIKIDNAVVLSHREKQDLSDYFAIREKTFSIEKDLEKIREEINALETACEDAIKAAERLITDFFTQFHEKVEINPRFYKVNNEQVKEIQEMFYQKDRFMYGIPHYRDQLASLQRDRKQVELKHLDFSDRNVDTKLKERLDILSHYRQALENIARSLENNVSKPVMHWVQILKMMEPDLEKMLPMDAVKYHLTAGRVQQARENLEALATSLDGLTLDTFQLLLSCYARLGLRDEYRNAYKRLGYLFGMIYPDFNQLNAYLKLVDDSVFLIRVSSKQNRISVGSGFSISPTLIVTNRHVVEGANPADIEIQGKTNTYRITKIELDPYNDLAILSVRGNLKPLRLGEFNFVEPGEQVLVIGFPRPESNSHSENIYISKGIVNSIRKVSAIAERGIFIDAKIGRGMSGGPLINDLGEVVGIVTLILIGRESDEKEQVFNEHQPVALPIYLVRKYLDGYKQIV